MIKGLLSCKPKSKSFVPQINFLEYRARYKTSTVGESGVCFSNSLQSIVSMISANWRNVKIEGSHEGINWHQIEIENETI